MDQDLNFLLGKMVARLDNNDEDHREIKKILKEVKDCTADMGKDITALKTKASVWGAVMGFIVSTVVVIIGWYVCMPHSVAQIAK